MPVDISSIYPYYRAISVLDKQFVIQWQQSLGLSRSESGTVYPILERYVPLLDDSVRDGEWWLPSLSNCRWTNRGYVHQSDWRGVRAIAGSWPPFLPFPMPSTRC